MGGGKKESGKGETVNWLKWCEWLKNDSKEKHLGMEIICEGSNLM